MKFTFTFTIVFLLAFVCIAQTKFMVAGGMDVIKTDFQEPFGKTQGNIELNYFIKQKVAFNAGYETWSGRGDFATLGMRYYLFSFIFLKARGLINDDDLNGTFSIGYQHFLGRRWRWESTLDYYASSPELAIRTGITYVFTK